MPGTKPLPIVAIEIFVEKDIIPEMRIVLQLRRIPKHRPHPLFIPEKNARKPFGQLDTDLIERI